jgi:hypothetical protein
MNNTQKAKTLEQKNQELIQFYKDVYIAAVRNGQYIDANYIASEAVKNLKEKMKEFEL